MCYWVAVVGNHKQGGPAVPFHPHRRRQQLRSNAYGKKKKKKGNMCMAKLAMQNRKPPF